jgi:hypothetical protein
MVVGRPAARESGEGVNILLSAIPWARDAVRRAQANRVDFGSGPVPALTLEDVIVSKLFCLGGAQLRAKDLDDLQSIDAAGHEVAIPYLAGQVRRLKIVVPRAAKPLLPEVLWKLARDALRP